MPYEKRTKNGKVCVYKKTSGEKLACYSGDDAEERANKYLAALNANLLEEEKETITVAKESDIDAFLAFKGGAGSGNKGHAGIKGHRGGSAPGGGGGTNTEDNPAPPSTTNSHSTSSELRSIRYKNTGLTSPMIVEQYHKPSLSGQSYALFDIRKDGTFRVKVYTSNLPPTRGTYIASSNASKSFSNVDDAIAFAEDKLNLYDSYANM